MSAPRGTWLRERSGDLNPGWAIVALFAVIGALGSLAVFGVALKDGAAASLMVASAFAFIAFVIVAAATMVVSIARAKLLNSSTTLQRLAKSIAAPDHTPDVDRWPTGDRETQRTDRTVREP